MNIQSDRAPESGIDPQVNPPATVSATRPLYWSLRRELWENRFVYIAPLIAASVMLCGFLITLYGLPRSFRELAAAHKLHVVMNYGHAAMLIVLTAFIVAVFYCLDALHGERRDRSILFWKSMPVSDLTTVLSKAAIPLVVLPLLVFAIVVVSQWIMLLLSVAVLTLSGEGAATLWSQVPLLQMEVSLLYGLIIMALWHAPIYAWLLLVSGWARRAAFLWAFFPPLAIIAFERIAFRTSHVASLLQYLFIGWFTQAFAATPESGPVDPHFIPLTQLAPGKFISTPGLWIGLFFAALFLAAAVRLRRYRGPI
jgi:ABC-2 type transport system permease protein